MDSAQTAFAIVLLVIFFIVVIGIVIAIKIWKVKFKAKLFKSV